MHAFLDQLGLADQNAGTYPTPPDADAGTFFDSHSPVDGTRIGQVRATDRAGYDAVLARAQSAFQTWRTWPAPKRGDIVRQLGEAFRENKPALGQLVSYEMGKSLQEGLGEVQEIIDICDFAVGLSRQLYGLTIASERPEHRMMEQWHPLGVVGVISAFNFPVAVWSWNAMLAWVCGDVVVWKPSEKTPLSALACLHIVRPVFERNGVPAGTFGLVSGGAELGQWLAADERVPLVSATGSTRMGRAVAGTRRRAAGTEPARTGRQQRHHRFRARRPRPGHSGHCLRGGRYRRAALHHHAAADRSRKPVRRSQTAPPKRLRSAAHRESARRSQPRRTTD
jgi:aldehyde dehydrogenase (NAD+)